MKVLADTSGRCIEDPEVTKQIRCAGSARSPEAQSRDQRVQGVARKPGAAGWAAPGAVRLTRPKTKGSVQMLRSQRCGRNSSWRIAGMEPAVEKSGRVYSDVTGIQAHSGLSNGCRAGHARSELLLDLAGKGVYFSYAQYVSRMPLS